MRFDGRAGCWWWSPGEADSRRDLRTAELKLCGTQLLHVQDSAKDLEGREETA